MATATHPRCPATPARCRRRDRLASFPQCPRALAAGAGLRSGLLREPMPEPQPRSGSCLARGQSREGRHPDTPARCEWCTAYRDYRHCRHRSQAPGSTSVSEAPHPPAQRLLGQDRKEGTITWSRRSLIARLGCYCIVQSRLMLIILRLFGKISLSIKL